MSDLIVPTLETVGFVSEIDQRAVEMLEAAQAVLDDSSEITRICNGVEAKTVPHSSEPGVTLEVNAKRATRTQFGVRLIFAHMFVRDPDGGMSMYLQRRNLHSYQLSEDPFANLILDKFTSHLA